MLGRTYRVLIKETATKPELEIENDGYLDEVVIDEWFHLEMMDDNLYWMRIGNDIVHVSKNEDGTISVQIERG